MGLLSLARALAALSQGIKSYEFRRRDGKKLPFRPPERCDGGQPVPMMRANLEWRGAMSKETLRGLERGLSVLAALESHGGLSLKDLHRRTDLPKPTLLRLSLIHI